MAEEHKREKATNLMVVRKQKKRQDGAKDKVYTSYPQ
jgi:hypothetical protein